jgi:hypothetical protein
MSFISIPIETKQGNEEDQEKNDVKGKKGDWGDYEI